MAQYAGKNLARILTSQPEFPRGDYKTSLNNAFLACDQELLQHPELKTDPSGATAVTCLLTGDTIYCVTTSLSIHYLMIIISVG